MPHENCIEFCVDFKSALGNINFSRTKKFIFLPYANLCKLGAYIVDMEFKGAGLSEDEFCQVVSKLHYLFKSYDKSAHQPQECHETTHNYEE